MSNERILHRITSEFLQRATSATSSEGILQGVTIDFTMSNKQQVNFNEQRVKSYASFLVKFQEYFGKMYSCSWTLKVIFNVKFSQVKRATRGDFVELGHFDKPFVKNGAFSSRYSYNYIVNGRFNPRMNTIRAFFSKIKALFFDFQKR